MINYGKVQNPTPIMYKRTILYAIMFIFHLQPARCGEDKVGAPSSSGPGPQSELWAASGTTCHHTCPAAAPATAAAANLPATVPSCSATTGTHYQGSCSAAASSAFATSPSDTTTGNQLLRFGCVLGNIFATAKGIGSPSLFLSHRLSWKLMKKLV